MKREFRYTRTSNKSLLQNPAHNFALNHTMKIFGANAAYTYIPKNACSTMRLSIAIANGCIKDASQVDWIHNNNASFLITTEAAFLVDYSFVILRCPFRRLYAAFLDKMVDLDTNSWVISKSSNGAIHPHDMTFAKFIELISKAPRHTLNHHWRPQVDFLLYENYDDFFCLEQFDDFVVSMRSRIGLDIVDARPYLNNNISDYEAIDLKEAYNKPALELLNLKKTGKAPNINSMYDSELQKVVHSVYKEDIEIFVEKFPNIKLMG